jgi:hypothetical protein
MSTTQGIEKYQLETEEKRDDVYESKLGDRSTKDVQNVSWFDLQLSATDTDLGTGGAVCCLAGYQN